MPDPYKKNLRKTKKSSYIALGSAVGVSAALLACCGVVGSNDKVTADCVDRSSYQQGSYRVVDDDYCEDSSSNQHGWYYGGSRRGKNASKGSFLRPKGADITSRSGKVIEKGGFGGRFKGGS